MGFLSAVYSALVMTRKVSFVPEGNKFFFYSERLDNLRAVLSR